jgi:hypothetical protein
MQTVTSRILSLCAAVIFAAMQPHAALSANKSITLAGETCDYKLSFDPAKAKETAVKDTFELLVMPSWAMTFGATAFSASDVPSIDKAEIARQCKASINQVKSIKLLPLAGVDEYRETVLKELDDSCTYHELMAAGYQDPSVLRRYNAAASCAPFIDALDGKSDLTAMFDQVNMKSCENNANTKTCLADAAKLRGNSAEMKVQVQTFGWSNCAVQFLLINTSKSGDTRQKLQKSFFKTYKAQALNCEGEEG